VVGTQAWVAENDVRLYLPVKLGRKCDQAARTYAVGRVPRGGPRRPQPLTLSFLEKTMWTKPEFTEMRFGFEVTMYIANR
jgi:coenzyme PQQ precursor peptide PqqA